MTNDNNMYSSASLLTEDQLQIMVDRLIKETLIIDTLINAELGDLLVRLTDEQISWVLYRLGWETLKSCDGKIKQSRFLQEKTLLFAHADHERILDKLTKHQRKSLICNLTWVQIIIVVAYAGNFEKIAKFADAIRSTQIMVWLYTLTEVQLWRLIANTEWDKIRNFFKKLTSEQLLRFVENITDEQLRSFIGAMDEDEIDIFLRI